MTFTNNEKTIINTLYKAQRPLTTRQVSEKSGLAWNTVKKWLEKLWNDKYVVRGEKKGAVYWWLKTP